MPDYVCACFFFFFLIIILFIYLFLYFISNNVSGAQRRLWNVDSMLCRHLSACVLDRYCFKERGDAQGVGELEE